MAKKLFQHSTISALMAGMFEGTLPIEKLLQQGNVGIGTFHGLDGELVVLDGTAYQIKVDGSVHEADPAATTPYAAVSHFEKETSFEIDTPLSAEDFKQQLPQHFDSENTFQTVKVTGQFNKMFCRSVEKQKAPYPRLAEVAKDQAEFRQEGVKGTLVGFYTPAIFETVAVPGFHLHFLSEEKNFGGHVLDFEVEKALVEWETIETLEQHFPLQNKTFMATEIDNSRLKEEIEEAE